VLQVILAGTILGILLHQWSGLAASSSGFQHAMLAQGLTAIVYQDPAYLVWLGFMLATYGACHILGSAIQSSRAAGAAAGVLLFDLTAAGTFLTSSFVAAVVVHQLYTHYVGTPEGPPTGAPPTEAGLHLLKSRAGSLSRPTLSRRPSLCSTRGQATDGWPFSSPTTPRTRRSSAQPCISLTYKLKLASSKAVSAACMLAYAWACFQAAGDTGGGWQGQAYAYAAVALTTMGALMLGLHAVCTLQSPAWYLRHMDTANRFVLWACVVVRLSLLFLHSLIFKAAGSPAGSSSGSGSASPAQQWLVQPRHAFHSFITLVFSLAVHEEPPKAFAVQVTGVAALCHWAHVQMAGPAAAAPSRDTAGVISMLLRYPEYWLGALFALVVYEWQRMGRVAKQAEVVPPTRRLWSTVVSRAVSCSSQMPSNDNSRCTSRQTSVTSEAGGLPAAGGGSSRQFGYNKLTISTAPSEVRPPAVSARGRCTRLFSVVLYKGML
jgi:hypothetical protein